MFKILILSSLIGIIYSIQLTEKLYKLCDQSILQQVNSVEVEPCTEEPCSFADGTEVTFIVNFVSSHNSNSDCKLDVRVLMGLWVPVFEEEVCASGELNCPLTNGGSHELECDDFHSSLLPQGNTLTRWRVLCNANTIEAFCVEVQFNKI